MEIYGESVRGSVRFNAEAHILVRFMLFFCFVLILGRAESLKNRAKKQYNCSLCFFS